MTKVKPPADKVDWDRVGKMARDAYHADSAVIDAHDFEAGYVAAFAEFAKRVSVGDVWQVADPMFKVVDVQVDKQFYRMLHGAASKPLRGDRVE